MMHEVLKVTYFIKGGVEALAEVYRTSLLSGKSLEALGVSKEHIEYIRLFEKYASLTASQIDFQTGGFISAGQAAALAYARDQARDLIKSVEGYRGFSTKLDQTLVKYPAVYPRTVYAQKNVYVPLWVAFEWSYKGKSKAELFENGVSPAQYLKITFIKKCIRDGVPPSEMNTVLHLASKDFRQIKKFLDKEITKNNKIKLKQKCTE